MKHIILVLLLLVLASSAELYRKLIHNTSASARCLDGTSPALYIHDGGDQRKIMIFFVGGGYCSGESVDQVLQSCYERTSSELGSSNYLPEQLPYVGGYLSTDPAQSRFATWLKIIVPYCDGAQHQGHNDEAIRYKDKLIYFRGSDNTRSHIDYLLKTYSLASADRVLFTGASAGGIATLMWSNYIRSKLNNPNNIVTIADSAIFANVSSPKTGKYNFDVVAKTLFKVSNIDEKSPIEGCNKKYPNEQYKCIFIQHYYEFLDSEVMFINSQYDAVGLQSTLDTRCMKKGSSGYTLKYCTEQEMSSIEGYRSEYLKIVEQLTKGEKKNSIWTISCCQHSYACYADFYNVEQQRVPERIGMNVKDAVEEYVFGSGKVGAFDQVPWPFNAACAF